MSDFEGFRLSPQQQHIWNIQQRHALIPHVLGAIQIAGDLDIHVLQQALEGVVSQYEILRTRFQSLPEMIFPLQVVSTASRVSWSAEQNYSDLRSEEQEHALELLWETTRQTAFNLLTGPVFQATLARCAPQKHLLVLGLSGLCADTSTLELLTEALSRVYGNPASLAESTGDILQYADFAEWQHELLISDETASGREYWQQKPAPSLPLPALPFEHRPSSQPAPTFGVFRHQLATTADLTRVCRTHQITPATFLQACWHILLHKYTECQAMPVATTFHGRTYEELQKSPGLISKYIPVQSEIHGGQTFRLFAQQLQQIEQEISEWQEYFTPLAHQKTHQALPFGFDFFDGTGSWQAQAVSFELARIESFLEPFMLRLEITETQAQGFQCAFHYDETLLHEQDVRCIAEHWQTLIEHACQQAEIELTQLSCLSVDEKQRLLAYGARQQRSLPSDLDVAQLFSAQATLAPEAQAVVLGDRQLSYRELDQQTNQLAHALRRAGIGPDTLVGIYMERSLEMVVGLLAVLKAGGAYVPLDPGYPAERLRFMIADAHVKMLLTQHHLRAQVMDQDTPLLCLDTDWESLVASEPDTSPVPVAGANNLAYVIYTSGSTGQPKGVMISRRSLGNHMLWMQEQFPLTVQDRVLQKTPFSFDASVWEFYAPLLSGALLVMAQPGGHQDASYLCQVINQFQITVLQVVPSFLRILLESPALASCMSLRRLYCGGEQLALELVEQCLAVLPSVQFCNLYGPTETTIQATFWVYQADYTRRQVSIGQPITNLQIYVLTEDLEVAATGLTGMVYIGGEGSARGYLGRPDLTAERFIPHPYAQNAGERLYMTGDLARYLPDGTLELLGRSDHQAKIRGFRVELGEIEAQIRHYPLVSACVVVIREDEQRTQRLVAYLVLEDGAREEEQQISQELRRSLQQTLPEYMLPSAFHILEEFPYLPNGKIDRQSLPDLISVRPELAVQYALPTTELERTLAHIWRDVLKVDRAGLYDNFFDLGGHSLLLIQVQSQIRQQLHISVSLVELFTYPTIHHLSGFLVARQKPSETPSAYEPISQRRLALRKRQGGFEDEIAIIGMVGRFPKARDLETFWQNLRAGVDAITFATTEELRAIGLTEEDLNDPNLVRAGGVLEDADVFDASFFGYSPREAAIMDPQHRLFLECAWHALEHAGYNSDEYSGLIGLYAGASVNDYQSLLEDVEGIQVLIGTAFDFLPTRVAYKLNLRGPSVDIQTACSTSLVAVHLAAQSLLHGECDMALAGGVSARFPQNAYLYVEGGIESRDGYCRSFDAKAQGAVSGNGIGIVVLKRLTDALADGDSIYAVIKGSAVNNDGSARAGYTAPGVAGQVAVIREALEVAGVSPEDISYVEAHGSGTPVGDPIEFSALAQAFRVYTDKKTFCAIGSVKTNIGHLDRAAGIAGLIKTVLALQHHSLPPSLHFEQPNEQIDFANSPFYVNTRLSEWTGEKPRIAGVSAFGLGGTNAHIIVTEAPTTVPSHVERTAQLIVLSAHTPSALAAIVDNLHQFIQHHSDVQLADVAYTLQVGRKPLQYKRMFVSESRQDVLQQLAGPDPTRVFTEYGEMRARSVVFLFPGIGDHYLHMSEQLYRTEPFFQAIIDRCSLILNPQLGLDVREILYPVEEPGTSPPSVAGPARGLLINRSKAPTSVAAQRFQQTVVLQPLLFMIEYALAQLWIEWGIKPQALLGHSLGEYTAACLAGVLSLEDALTLVAKRAQLIQTLPASAMLAVPLSEQEITPLLNAQCEISALNGPQLTAISGSLAGIEELEALLQARNIFSQRLQSNHAFHSSRLEAIVEPFRELVRTISFKEPALPYISTLTGKWIKAEEASDPEYWVKHLCQPVRFVDSLHELLQTKDLLLLEVGPGQSLASFVHQHPDLSPEHRVLSSLQNSSLFESQSEKLALLSTLGKLWLSGQPICWAALHSHEQLHRIPLPLYPFEHQRYWFRPYRAPQRPTEISADSGKRSQIDNWFYTPGWIQGASFSDEQVQLLSRQTALWILFVNPGQLGETLAGRLRQAGQEVIILRMGEVFSKCSQSEYLLPPGDRHAYELFVQELLLTKRYPIYVLHFWNLADDEPEQEIPLRFRYWQNRGYYSLLFFAQALETSGLISPYQQQGQPMHLAVVANQICAVTAEEVLCPEKTTILAICKVLQQEYRTIICHCIDTPLPRRTSQYIATGEHILAEVLAQNRELTVAYRGNQRWVQTMQAYPLRDYAQKKHPLRQKGVYLITGGLGGFGLLVAEELARTVQARLVLVSRSGLPERPAWPAYLETHDADDPIGYQIRQVQHIEALGADVWILRADVTDARQMQTVVDQIMERFAVLHGVIHAVGALVGTGVGPISEITREASEALFEPKVHSLPVLADVLEGKPLDFCLLFSSNASVLGGLGFAAYAAANQYIDAFAAYQSQKQDVLWISTNWDSWSEEEGQTADARSSMDQYRMTRSEFMTAFARIVSLAREPQIIVSAGDLSARLKLWVQLDQSLTEPQKQNSLYPRPGILTAYQAPRNEIERQICESWQQVLGIEMVGIFDNFFEIGGHSLLALQIVSQLRAAFQLALPLQTLVEEPTVARLAEAIVHLQTEQVDRALLSDLLIKVETLSDDELQIALQESEQGSADE